MINTIIEMFAAGLAIFGGGAIMSIFSMVLWARREEEHENN